MNRAASLTFALMFLAACTGSDDADIGTREEGGACSQISDCKAGLDCVDDTCTPLEVTTGGPMRGDACAADADCAPELFCGPQNACSPNPGAVAGEPCGLTVECQPPWVCHGNDAICVDPTNANPGDPSVPADFGVKDFGDPCDSFTDCRRPYLCPIGVASPTCSQIPLYLGPSCTRTDEEAGAFRTYYELPPAEIPAEYEFYRLPFPNDIRMSGGSLSLAGHASPGEVLGIDVAGAYLSAIVEDADGFAINGTVFFRFTDPPRNGSLCLDPGGIYPELEQPAPCPAADPGCAEPDPPEPFCSSAGEATVFLVDVDDPASASYGTRIPVQMAVKPERSQYICQNTVAISPRDGEPLEPDTTYAAVVTTGIRDVRNGAPIQDLDFERVLNADPRLSQQVLDATAPLRQWIAEAGIDESTIAAATVFTTGNPASLAEPLRDAVYALPAPAFDGGAFECGTPAPPAFVSSCHEPAGALLPRDCSGSPVNGFEIHGTYQAPAFQTGTRPYATTADGGALSLDGSGNPQKVFDETICFALRVPGSGTFPVVIFAHGTGGNYRSFALDPLTEQLVASGYAVVSFDNVMHGPRQDPAQAPAGWSPASWDLVDPGRLFFNVVNPRAARDNVLQGAADLFYLTRLLRETPAINIDGVGSVDFDPAQVFFLGHSQGTVIAPAYLSAESGVQAAIFSGAGAELALSILNKREPVDLAEVTGAFFADRGLSRLHPMVALMAIMFGPSDAVSYARTMVSNPGLAPPRSPRPFLVFSGLGDSFTPDQTQDALIRSMNIPLVLPTPQSIDGVQEVDAPLDGNFDGVTAGAVRLAPDCALLTSEPACGATFGCSWDGACSGSYDGHFVLFSHPEGATILESFLATAEIDR